MHYCHSKILKVLEEEQATVAEVSQIPFLLKDRNLLVSASQCKMMFSWLLLSSARVTVYLFIICFAPNHLQLQSKLSAAFKCKEPRSIITTQLESSPSWLWIVFCVCDSFSKWRDVM